MTKKYRLVSYKNEENTIYHRIIYENGLIKSGNNINNIVNYGEFIENNLIRYAKINEENLRNNSKIKSIEVLVDLN